MNVTATMNGDFVTIVDMDVQGSVIYVSYIDSSDNLKVSKMNGMSAFGSVAEDITIALSATAV